MIKIKQYRNKRKVSLHVFVLSVLLIFITLFGFTLSKTFTGYVEADTNGAIRGQPYDLWADKVYGKRDFTEISPKEVVPDKVSSPGGVIVDRSVTPGRAYIWDSSNSRILGVNLADCYAVAVDERCSAQIVIGQPSGIDYGACNLDSSFQYYPDRGPASASTICGVSEWTHTTLEDKTFTSMFVDTNGDLYVDDVYNHRVLKYISPFTTDTIADDFWGQDDFSGNLCNKTKGYLDNTPQPTASSFCFLAIGNGGAGVSLDEDGNLWVADGGNTRVLRFPLVNGIISKTADIVIGHSNFTTGGDYSGDSTNNRLSSVTAVRFDNIGRMYIADVGNTRLMRYAPPFSTGMSGTPILDSSDFPDGFVSIEMDATNSTFFTYENEGPGAKVQHWELDATTMLGNFSNWNPGGGSLGIDTNGNVLVSAYVYQQDVARFAPNAGDFESVQSFFSPPGGYNLTSARRLAQGGWAGVAAISNQLIVSDGRLLYWNDPLNGVNGSVPNGYVSAASGTDYPDPGYGIMQADKNNRLYAAKGNTIQVFQAPLTNSSTPITTITLPLTGVAGGTIGIAGSLGGLAVTPNSEYLWLTDTDNHRVLRIKNPLTNPLVDIVIGQTSLSGVNCNKNVVPPPNVDGSISADRSMLCHPGELSLDNYGNLYISDHFFEANGNWRILMYSPDLFPTSQSSILFNISATKEFPRINNITNFAPATFELAFDSTNRMVAGYNPYFGPRFLEFYNNPEEYNPSNRSDPAFAVADGKLKDFYGWAFSMAFDENDNLFVYDTNRGKILVYQDPFGTPEEENNGGGGNNNGQNNNSGATFSTYNSSTNNSGSTGKMPISFVQVSDIPISFSESTVTPPDSTAEAIQDLVSNTESNKTFSLILGVLVELAKNSNTKFALNFAATSLGLFLLITAIALSLSSANPLGLLPLFISSILNRSKNYGGIIYNSVTGKPVALAKISILRKEAIANNNVAAVPIETSLTDLEGRYKLSTPASKNLSIEVKSLGYEYFIKTLPSNFDVPLVPVKENKLLKRILSVNKITLFRLLRLTSLFAAIWGYIVTIYEQVSNPNIVN
ncbi:MAG: hypothetical protein SGJ04_08850, partial [Bacteroidota bacterium]|nr:hypothetical protein [Bacteroidota bacterium]